MKKAAIDLLKMGIISATLMIFAFDAAAQLPDLPSHLEALGTRTWIRLNWQDNAANEEGYKIYWSTASTKPFNPQGIVTANETQFYIRPVDEATQYYVWIEAYNDRGVSKAISTSVTTTKTWSLHANEAKNLYPASSSAVPEGMQLFWHDEFNDLYLNRNKWSTNYYSSIGHLRGEVEENMRNDNIPQPAYLLNGKTIDLYVSDSLPERTYGERSNKKISSIQTYDWRTNENLLDNSRGGYFEVKVKRRSTGKPRSLNTAFWFDAPGPDLRNYLEKGTILNGVEGVRPKGQVFEIDVFEYLNAQFVLHGHVDTNGRFQRNLATHIAEGYTHVDNWVTHGILWTPTGIKHYVNGDLIKKYTDKHQVYSPNHFMNVLLGSYGGGGTVNMEVDYIRGYQWPLSGGNELPNPGFEDSGSLAPWEGDGSLVAGSGKNKSNGVLLKPGQTLEQYVYLNNEIPYSMDYWIKGRGTIRTAVDNMTQVTGELIPIDQKKEKGKQGFIRKRLNFKTGVEYRDYLKTIRVSFSNEGDSDIILDDITVKKRNKVSTKISSL